MIFILLESIMNGTVTAKNNLSGIEAKDFASAKNRVKELPNFGNMRITTETDDLLSFVGPSTSIDMPLYCAGEIKNEPLKML